MKTDKQLLIKALQSFGYTVILLFLGPFLLYQAFRNEDHPFFIPVLVLGLLVACGAVYLGFRSVMLTINAVFGKKSNKLEHIQKDEI